jgi:predicted DNA-binding mobile mystery protein A
LSFINLAVLQLEEQLIMRNEFRNLRIRQLDRGLLLFQAAKDVARPQRGWIRAIREATGQTLREIGERFGASPSSVASFEKSEAEYRISLGKLREVADALGCELVYALVPKQGTLSDLAEHRATRKVAENVRAVEHTMALEDQAVGGVEEKIQEHARQILKRAKSR